MLYVETQVASLVFGVCERGLRLATQRNSTKYPFLRLQEAGTRSRGGVKLLFEVEIADISSLVRAKKLSSDIEIYVPDSSAQSKNGLKMMKFSEIKNTKTHSNDNNEQDEATYILKLVKKS